MHKMLCKSMLEICNPLSISSFSVADEQLTSEGLYSVREKACDWPSHSSSNSIFQQKFILKTKIIIICYLEPSMLYMLQCGAALH
jgi:hypothetical protein